MQVDSSEDTVVVDNIDDIRSLLIRLLIYPFRISNILYELDVTKLQKKVGFFRSRNRIPEKFLAGVGVGIGIEKLFFSESGRV